MRDVDSDGEEDLVTDVRVGDGVVTKAVLPGCLPEGETTEKAGPLPPERDLQLVWTAASWGFKPSPATARHLEQLEAARKKAETD